PPGFPPQASSAQALKMHPPRPSNRIFPHGEEFLLFDALVFRVMTEALRTGVSVLADRPVCRTIIGLNRTAIAGRHVVVGRAGNQGSAFEGDRNAEKLLPTGARDHALMQGASCHLHP